MTSLCTLSDLAAAFTNVLSFIFHMLSTKSRVWSMHFVFSFFVLKLSVCLYVWVCVCERVGALFMYLLYFHTLELVHPSNCTLNDNEVYLFVVFLFFFFQSSSSASRWQSSTTSPWSMLSSLLSLTFHVSFLNFFVPHHACLLEVYARRLSLCNVYLFIYLFCIF